MTFELRKVPKPRKRRRVRLPSHLTRSPMRKNGPRTKRTGGNLFPGNVDKAYRAWIRSLPCILAGRARTTPLVGNFGSSTERHYCFGRVQGCHVQSRATGGVDIGNMYPGCARAHDEQGQRGIPAFEQRWSVNLKAIATILEVEYRGVPHLGAQP